MALGNYQGLDGYLATTHRNTAHPTVLPGQIDASRKGYGAYIGDEISTQAALDRMSRDVEDTRVALDNAMKFQRGMADHEDYMAQRDYRNNAARIANERITADHEDYMSQRPWRQREAERTHDQREMEWANAKARFAAENKLLNDASDEADLTVEVNRSRREKFRAAKSVPHFMLITELYNDGRVSKDSIAAYNASAAEDGYPPLKDFRQDPATGEMYGVTEKDEIVPYSAVGVLDAWAAAHPHAKEWILRAYPKQIQEAKVREFERQDALNKQALAQAKNDQARAKEAREYEMKAYNRVIDDYIEQRKEIRRRLDEETPDEKMRLELEAEYKRLTDEQNATMLYLRKLINPNAGVPTTTEGGASIQSIQTDAAGVSAGNNGISSWNATPAEQPQ